MCFYSQRLNQTFSYSKIVNIVTPQKYNDNCVMNINKQCLLFIEIVQLYILFILKSLISNNNKNEQQKKQYKELIIRVYTYTFFYQKVFFQKTLKLFLTVFLLQQNILNFLFILIYYFLLDKQAIVGLIVIIDLKFLLYTCKKTIFLVNSSKNHLKNNKTKSILSVHMDITNFVFKIK